MCTVSAVSAPAAVFVEERPSVGVKVVGGQLTTSPKSVGEAAAPPLKGVIVAVAV